MSKLAKSHGLFEIRSEADDERLIQVIRQDIDRERGAWRAISAVAVAILCIWAGNCLLLVSLVMSVFLGPRNGVTDLTGGNKASPSSSHSGSARSKDSGCLNISLAMYFPLNFIAANADEKRSTELIVTERAHA